MERPVKDVYAVVTLDYPSEDVGDPYISCLAVFESMEEATSFKESHGYDYCETWVETVRYYPAPLVGRFEWGHTGET